MKAVGLLVAVMFLAGLVAGAVASLMVLTGVAVKAFLGIKR